MAFDFAGTLTAGLPAVKVAAHAAIGCASSAASGGKCGAGALSGGISAAAGQILPHTEMGDCLVVRASIGGLASVAGGGKFGNGAVTAAFGYLLNDARHDPDQGQRQPSGTQTAFCLPCGVLAGELLAGMIGLYDQVFGEIPFTLNDDAFDVANDNWPFHGNDNRSTRQTYVYEVYRQDSPNATLKYGITYKNPVRRRYPEWFYDTYNADIDQLAQFNNRALARSYEQSLCFSYVAANGKCHLCHVNVRFASCS